MVSLVLKHPDTGAVVFDADKETVHIRASFIAGPDAGSQTVAGLDQGFPFILSATPVSGSGVVYPDFTFSGNTVSWTASGWACKVIVATHS